MNRRFQLRNHLIVFILYLVLAGTLLRSETPDKPVELYVNGTLVKSAPQKRTRGHIRQQGVSETVIADEEGRYLDPERQSLCLAMRDLFRQINNGLPKGWKMEDPQGLSLGRFLLPEPSFFVSVHPPGHTKNSRMFSCLEAAEQIPGTNRFERIDLLDDETMFSRLYEIVERNEETVVISNRVSGFTATKQISSLNRGIVILTNEYVAVHLMVFSPARKWADWDGFAQIVNESLQEYDWSAFESRRRRDRIETRSGNDN